jgi:hypothetical protein
MPTPKLTPQQIEAICVAFVQAAVQGVYDGIAHGVVNFLEPLPSFKISIEDAHSFTVYVIGSETAFHFTTTVL